MSVAPGNHDDRSETRPVDHVGGDHPRATAADAARTIAGSAHQATLATITDRPAGYPFASLVSYTLDADGNPLFMISTMAEHTRNATRDERASLLITERSEGHDPLDAGRVTLVDAVPTVGRYAHFGDFSCWRLTMAAVRWVGGFGTMDWIEADQYAAASVDRVLAERRGVLDHMNADHADACLAIIRQALQRDDITRAEMVGVDRFGCDYVATTSGDRDVAVRVPFESVVSELGEVRRQLVAQTVSARGS